MLRKAVMAALTMLHRVPLTSALTAPFGPAGPCRPTCTARHNLQMCSRGWRAACRADSGAQLNSVDEILEGISNKGFSARTVDYDADSDSSSDEFVFVEERPTALPSSGPAAAAEPGPPASSQDDASSDEEEAAAEMSEGADEEDFEPDEEDEDEDDEPPLPASSGDGPIVEYSPSTSWAEPALEVAQRVLGRAHMAGLELYSFRAAPVNERLYMRIDKLEDVYGSPSMDDITSFSREFYAELETALGEEAAGNLQIEVSSPGAERLVRVPGELLRFQSLPMQVTYQQDAEGDVVETRVLQLLGYDEAGAATEWGLANVKVNRQKRLGRLTKKETQQRFNLPVTALKHVQLHLDL